MLVTVGEGSYLVGLDEEGGVRITPFVGELRATPLVVELHQGVCTFHYPIQHLRNPKQ